MLAPSCEAVVLKLRKLPESEIVRVVVQGGGSDTEPSKLRPKDFPDATAYRTALQLELKKKRQPGRAYVLETARSLGLSARAASAINVVTLEGKVKHVLALIGKVQPEMVMLDREMKLTPLPPNR